MNKCGTVRDGINVCRTTIICSRYQENALKSPQFAEHFLVASLPSTPYRGSAPGPRRSMRPQTAHSAELQATTFAQGKMGGTHFAPPCGLRPCKMVQCKWGSNLIDVNRFK